MFHMAVAWWELGLRAIVIYFALLAGLRLFGKREVGQFTLFDLVLVLLVANAVQPAMTGPDSSLLGGIVIIVALLVANLAISRLRGVPALARLFAPAPTVIVHDGKLLTDRMRREGVDEDDVMTAIREHGLAELSDVHLCVLEPDGSISVVGKDAATRHRPQRRSRYVRRP